MKKIVFGIIGLFLVVLVVVRVVQASAEQDIPPGVEEIRRQSGIPVEVATARSGPLVVSREFTGTVRGIRSATIRARTGDEIVEIPVRVGQRVAAGDVLIRQSQEGSMASVRQAEAAYEQASRTVERLRPLREQGAISEQDWDNATTALSVAEANLAAARSSVELTSPIAGSRAVPRQPPVYGREGTDNASRLSPLTHSMAVNTDDSCHVISKS